MKKLIYILLFTSCSSSFMVKNSIGSHPDKFIIDSLSMSEDKKVTMIYYTDIFKENGYKLEAKYRSLKRMDLALGDTLNLKNIGSKYIKVKK